MQHRTILELDAGRAAVLHNDSPHGCGSTDRRAGSARGICDALRDRAHSSVNPAPGARPAIDFPDPVMQQHVGGARAHRSAPCAENRLRPECALDPLVLEPLVEELLARNREQPHDLGDIPGIPMAELGSQREQSRRIAQRKVRRDLEHQVLQHLSEPREILVEFDVRSRVLLRELCDFLGGLLQVSPQRERSAVREWRPIVGIEDRDPVAIALEFELLDDFRRHQAHHVGRGRDVVAGPAFIGHGSAPQHVLSLQHEDIHPCPSEVRGAGEPVVATTDDDRVVSLQAPLLCRFTSYTGRAV